MTTSSDPSELNHSHLPAIIPPAALVLRRTQTTLGLLRDVAQESSAEYWYTQGIEACARQEWEKATNNFRACIARDYNHWRATLQLTVALAQRGDITAAKTVKYAFNMPCLRWRIWEAELSSQQWQMLRDFFESQKDNYPDDYTVLFALSLIYWIIGQYYKALKIMETFTLDLLNSIPDFYRLIGAIEASIQINVYFDFEKADEAFSKSADISKSDNDFYSLGIIKERVYDHVMADYKTAISINKNHAFAHFKVGESYYRMEEYIQALPYFEQATKIDSDFALAFLGLSNCHEHMGNTDAAIINWKLAFIKDPSLIEGNDYHFLYIYNGLESEHLIEVYNRLVEDEPDNTTFLYKRGILKRDSGDGMRGVADMIKSKEMANAKKKD